jgi:hypothetical protein
MLEDAPVNQRIDACLKILKQYSPIGTSTFSFYPENERHFDEFTLEFGSPLVEKGCTLALNPKFSFEEIFQTLDISVNRSRGKIGFFSSDVFIPKLSRSFTDEPMLLVTNDRVYPGSIKAGGIELPDELEEKIWDLRVGLEHLFICTLRESKELSTLIRGYDLKDDSKIFSLVFPSVDFQVEL